MTRPTGTTPPQAEGKRRYTAARSPVYHGHPDAIDETGTKAAAHMALIDARRLIEKAYARANPESAHGPFIIIRRGREADALRLILDALRANAPSIS